MTLWHARAAGRVVNVLGRALTEAASNPQHRLQIYVSRDEDPHVNLAIEQHLLEASHRDSRILFLYANRPSVIIGRSQNPWLETDLARIRSGLPPPSPSAGSAGSPAVTVPVDLVRRRSGGGTVFHDRGNMNYSVIAPRAGFDPDRHALMVAAALREALAVPGVRVTERHDIVMDVPLVPPAVSTFKISGSAYRLNGMRSLHHGTCLLCSPHLSQIGPLLRSPAEPFLRSTGIASVRSPVRNVGADPAAFQQAVRDRFTATYQHHLVGGDGHDLSLFVGSVGGDAVEIPEVAKVVAELRSPEWKFGQTTQFTFSTHPTDDDPRERPPPPPDVPSDFRATMTIRHGKIKNCDITGIVDSAAASSLPPQHTTTTSSSGTEAVASLGSALVGLNMHEITDWRDALARLSPVSPATLSVGRWLNGIFGNIHCP